MIGNDMAINTASGCTVALGTFDGVHLGHQKVIECALEFGLPVVIVTFKQNPQSVIKKSEKLQIYSQTIADEIFAELGAYKVVRLDFEKVMNYSPDEYLDFIKNEIGAKNIVFGFNFRFGKGAKGNKETAQDYCARYSLGLKVCDEVCVDGETVSSTRIRAAIANGDMELAEKLLGRKYMYDFAVCHGEKRGRTIDIPTANQPFEDSFLLPRFGVYASLVTVDKMQYHGITNIGKRPTFPLENAVSETYIDGFSGDLYGKRVRVALVKFIREEMKFDSLESLKNQIKIDLETAKRLSID